MVVIAHPLTPSLDPTWQRRVLQSLDRLPALVPGFQFIVPSRTGKDFVCASASSGDDPGGDDEGPNEDGVAEVGIAVGRGREGVVGVSSEDNNERCEVTILKNARTAGTSARRTPPFHGPGRQAGRDGVAMYYDRRRWWWEAECSMQ